MKYISTIADLSRIVEEEFHNDIDTTVIYRGHGAVSYKLRPRVGRLNPPDNSGRDTVNEKLMLELFRRQSPDLITIAAKNDWELLAIAQHHGMATRLLDWTRNPLVALYFAVCRECEFRDSDGRPQPEDAEIIAWRSQKEDLTRELPPTPFEFKDVLKYVPCITTPRLRRQSGLFTAHPDPKVEFAANSMVRIRIRPNDRKLLKDSLQRHGINESVLFPDVDALARHIDWCQTKSY